MSGEYSVTPTAPVKPGDVLAGRYRVERVLAAGGMGVVVAARHVTLNQKVAVKFLLGSLANNVDASRRFEREAKAAALLRSEHVARVIDVGTMENGAPYLVMEFLEGDDLANILDARGPLPIGEVVEYVLQALEGLAEAHAAGIVHRDLKPSNLFRTHRPDGSPVVKVLDFGISKVDDVNQMSVTATTAILGSPLYMSPEQMASAKSADGRSDVWSMGVVLFQLLTGAAPFDGESLPALVLSINSKPPKQLRALRPDAPPQLEEVILRCLAKAREERFANVADLAVALAPFAPSSALTHVERIQRMRSGSANSGAFAISHSSSQSGILKHDSFGTTKTALAESMEGTTEKKRGLPVGAIVAMVAGSALVITLGLIAVKSMGSKDSTTPSATAAATSPPTSATTTATAKATAEPTTTTTATANPTTTTTTATATATAKPSATVAATHPTSNSTATATGKTLPTASVNPPASARPTPSATGNEYSSTRK